jgi:hypothetical protein
MEWSSEIPQNNIPCYSHLQTQRNYMNYFEHNGYMLLCVDHISQIHVDFCGINKASGMTNYTNLLDFFLFFY